MARPTGSSPVCPSRTTTTFGFSQTDETLLLTQPDLPQNWAALQAVPQAPQCALSLTVSTQCSEQQVRPVPQPALPPSCCAVQAAAHCCAPHTLLALHS